MERKKYQYMQVNEKNGGVWQRNPCCIGNIMDMRTTFIFKQVSRNL